MTPQEMDFGPSAAVELAQRRLRMKLDEAVSVLTLSGAAKSCGCSSSRLRDALDGRNGSHVPTQWAMAISRAVGGDLMHEVKELICEAMDPGPSASDDAFIEALMAGLKSFGDQGEIVLKAIRRRCKR